MLRIELIGHLGADCTKKMKNGVDFYAFSVASSRFRTNKETGERTEETTWVSAIINWDASSVAKYLVKGAKVFVRGDLYLSSYTDKAGKELTGLNMRVTEIELCGIKNE